MLALSIISLVVAISAAIFAGLQLMRMRQTWQAQNALEVARDIQSTDQRDSRKDLYILKARKTPYEEWTIQQRNNADHVVQQLSTAAYLSEKRLLPPKMLEENWHGILRSAFRAAEPRIDDRGQRGTKAIWDPFVRFAERMLETYGEPDFYVEEH